jgi:hypothetical protein
MIVMLLAAVVLAYTAEPKESKKGKFNVTIITSLAFVIGDLTKLALDDDTYFELIPLKQ